ncbi:uncharacterized protein TM35_000232250 [Trypanosoma theileri]|uniref:Uncharacterized protein n=1 Tax=Trypanosoma theileri TaxID=67003 RepID=A0A1X0NRD1_9TRYP|nr:uncharacterized protein TM35_000232250 [Trypanosoma theileri]ORC87254.1 hypothetical protein TM35_000232250 [Trypanosoma theileri]
MRPSNSQPPPGAALQQPPTGSILQRQSSILKKESEANGPTTTTGGSGAPRGSAPVSTSVGTNGAANQPGSIRPSNGYPTQGPNPAGQSNGRAPPSAAYPNQGPNPAGQSNGRAPPSAAYPNQSTAPVNRVSQGPASTGYPNQGPNPAGQSNGRAPPSAAYPNQSTAPVNRVSQGPASTGYPNQAPNPAGQSNGRAPPPAAYPNRGAGMGGVAPMQNRPVGDSTGLGRQGSFKQEGSFRGPGAFGSAYAMPGANRDSFYGGSKYGSMGPGMGGSMYGAPGMGGSMYGAPGMGGSMYGGGSRMGSMYGAPGMGGSMYGAPGMGGSMYGAPGMGGSMYGAPGMGGSMYGGSAFGSMGGSMYGGQGITAQWGSLANMSRNSLGGSMYRNSSQNLNLICPTISSIKDHVALQRSAKRGGKVTTLESKDADGKPISTGTAVSSLIVRKSSFVKTEDGKANTSERGITRINTADQGITKAKVPANYNIHSLIVVEKGADPSKKVVVSVKNPNTITFKREDGKEESFENDECLLRDKKSSTINSVLLLDLQSNWFAGHTSGLLIGAGKGCGQASVEYTKAFLVQCVEKLEKEEKEKSTTFDITITMGMVESSDRIRDLLNPDNKDYEKMQLGSSPVFGPCLCGMKTKTVTSSKEFGKVFDEAVKRGENEKHMIIGFFVLKQIKKSSTEKDIYLSSLALGMAREETSHLTGLREKSKSEPCVLFRYAVGGASVTVSAVLLSDQDSESRGCLEMERKMREIKNTPPRSGNIRRCLEMTNKEISRQKDKLEKASESEKKSIERIVDRMKTMVQDCEEMISKPEKTAPKGYPMAS